MDNENKDMELDTQNMEPEVEEVAVELPESTPGFDEAEFDPTESEEFYNNLEAAIGAEEEFDDTELPELLLTEETFALDADPEPAVEPSVDEELFAGVDAALAEQIEQEFGKETEISSTEEKEPNKFVAGWKAIPTWTKVLVSIILAILISVGLLFGTEGGKNIVYKVIVGIAFEWIKIEDPNNISPTPDLEVTISPEPTEDPLQNPDTTPEPTVDPSQSPDATPEPTVDPNATPTAIPELTATPTPTPSIQIMDDEDIINILLLGEEDLFNNGTGRTDAIIVVSINLNGGPLKMVSFQRDLYVQIPGYADDRLNAAYGKKNGGAMLVMETIEQNFGIDIDSYVKVGFDGFEDIIDMLGGLRLSLTAKESEYLNTTKYISKPEERNTIAGYQTMTGSQVLGYCRVRKVPTAEGLTNDRGRNYRHRVVLQAIFDQYKDKNIIELMTVMGQCFKYVSAPADLEDLAVDCLRAVVENKMFEIKTMQVPQNNLYDDTTISGKDVIVFYPECVDKLQEFIYADE